jgi:hypothetical protein
MVSICVGSCYEGRKARKGCGTSFGVGVGVGSEISWWPRTPYLRLEWWRESICSFDLFRGFHELFGRCLDRYGQSNFRCLLVENARLVKFSSML